MRRDLAGPVRTVSEIPRIGDDGAVGIVGRRRVENDGDPSHRALRQGERGDRRRKNHDVTIGRRGKRFVVGDGQGHVDGAVDRVCVGRHDTRRSCGIPEIPGVRDDRSVRVGRARGVEGCRPSLDHGVRSRGEGRGRWLTRIPIDRRRRRQPEYPVRSDLDRDDRGRRGPEDLVGSNGIVVWRDQVKPVESTRVAIAHEEVALPSREVGSSVDCGVCRANCGPPPPDRQDGVRTILVRVARGWRWSRARVVGSPAVVVTRR